jgi:catechol 2,3-dioxygenase-like lactoylglutathione lyase family enzyme
VTLSIFSTTFDCHDPDRMAAFWAEALGYEVNTADVMAGEAWIDDPAGKGPRVLFIAVPEWLHLDLFADGHVEPEVERVKALGATEHGTFHDPDDHPHGFYWTLLQDPEGNEFCIGEDQSNRA